MRYKYTQKQKGGGILSTLGSGFSKIGRGIKSAPFAAGRGIKRFGSWTGSGLSKIGRGIKSAPFAAGRGIKRFGSWAGRGIGRGASSIGRKISHGVSKRAAKLKEAVSNRLIKLKSKLTPKFIKRRMAMNKFTKNVKNENFAKLISSKSADEQKYLLYLQNPAVNPRPVKFPEGYKDLDAQFKTLNKASERISKDFIKVSKLPNSPLKAERFSELTSQREKLLSLGTLDKQSWKKIGQKMKDGKRDVMISQLRLKNPNASREELKSFAERYLHKQKKLSKTKGLSSDQFQTEMKNLQLRQSHAGKGWYGSKYAAQRNSEMRNQLKGFHEYAPQKYDRLIKEGYHPREAFEKTKRMDNLAKDLINNGKKKWDPSLTSGSSLSPVNSFSLSKTIGKPSTSSSHMIPSSSQSVRQSPPSTSSGSLFNQSSPPTSKKVDYMNSSKLYQSHEYQTIHPDDEAGYMTIGEITGKPNPNNGYIELEP